MAEAGPRSGGADSTVDEVVESRRPLAVWLRRAATLALALVVASALVGALGVRTAEVQASANGYELSLRYPQVARAGLDTTWEVTVSRAGGFEDDVVLAVTGAYFDLFETQAFHPEPSDGTRDATTLYLTFAAPESDTFVVAYDAYIQPSSQIGQPARVSVVDETVDGRVPLVSVDYRTRLLP